MCSSEGYTCSHEHSRAPSTTHKIQRKRKDYVSLQRPALFNALACIRIVLQVDHQLSCLLSHGSNIKSWLLNKKNIFPTEETLLTPDQIRIGKMQMDDPLASLQAHILMADQKCLIVPEMEVVQVGYLEVVAKFSFMFQNPP